MKRIIALALSVFSAGATASAQDFIIKNSGEDIKAKVIEVAPGKVKYRLWDEPDGAVYTVKKSDILMIHYESGRNEVFNADSGTDFHVPERQPVEGIVPGMKYSQLKKLYNYRDWTSMPGDKYSPIGAGLASLFIPGLGQITCGEVRRGLAWMGGACGCMFASILGYISAESNNPAGSFFGLAGALGGVTVYFWSIIDAQKVAIVKNMYFQDLKSQYSLDVELYPSVNCVQTATGIRPAAGLTLAVRF